MIMKKITKQLRIVLSISFLLFLFININANNEVEPPELLTPDFIENDACAPIRLKLPYKIISENDSMVCLSLTVDNFKNISAFQFSIGWDDKVLKYNSVNVSNASFLVYPNFVFNNPRSNELRFTFVETVKDGRTLPNNSELIEMCFDVVGSYGESSPVVFNTLSYLPIEFINWDDEVLDYIIEDGNVSINSQNNDCVSYIQVDLDEFGTAVIPSKDFFNDASVNSVLIGGQTELLVDCDDLGTKEVSVLVKYDSGDTVKCTSFVRVRDIINPVVILKSDPKIIISNDGDTDIDIDMLVDSIYDNCDYQIEISPSHVNCNTSSPVELEIRIVDINGNCSTNTVLAELENDYDFEFDCIEKLMIDISLNKSVQLDVEDVLDGSFDCIGTFDLEVFGENGSPLTSLVFDENDNNKVFNYTVSESNSGKTCSGNIFVIGYDCTDQITESKIEWPCDINSGLEIICFYNNSTLTPEELFNKGIDENCIQPKLINFDCHTDSISWKDYVTEHDGFIKISRKWTIIDKVRPNNKFYHTQEIYVKTGDESDRVICDILPWSAPFGGCESGHTSEDLIELPEKFIELFWLCDDVEDENFGTSELAKNQFIDYRNIKPLIDKKWCREGVEVFFNDNTLMFGGGKKILRNWVIINDYTGSVLNWKQEIKIHTSPLVCDTLPWDYPFGDCESGHTLNDIVEWPRDLTVNNSNISIWSFKNNSDIHPFDVEPRLFVSCGDYKVSYDDVFDINENGYLVNRTWTIYFPLSGDSYEYVQKINIISSAKPSFCVYTPTGLPISDVSILDSLDTGELGCVDLQNILEGSNITPLKNDDFSEGIDIGDIVLLQKYILGIASLNPYQMLAADLNFDKKVTYEDLALLRDYFEGAKEYSSPVWLFSDASFDLTIDNFYNYKNTVKYKESIDNYNFIGVKMGDINNSWSRANEEKKLLVQDTTVIGIKKYNVPVILNNDFQINGISLKIIYDRDKIEINKITSEAIPDFKMFKNVDFRTDGITIRYVSSNFSLLHGGNKVNKGQKILDIEFIAKDISLLSEIISVSEDFENVIITEDANFNIEFEWQKAVPTIDIEGDEIDNISIYPNPAKKEINIRFNNKYIPNINYSIINIVGQKVQESKLTEESIDISNLEAGLYYIKFIRLGEIMGVKKLIVN